MKFHLSLLLALLPFFTPAKAQTTTDHGDTITIAVLALNDFHGAFVQNTHLQVPGAPSILQTVDSLRQTYPFSVVVSVGDNFGGSYFYNMTHGQLLPGFFDALGIRRSAVGNHEFDDGREALAAKWKETPMRPADWDVTYVCSNVYDADGRVPAYMQPYVVDTLRLSPTRSVSIGFLGLLASSAKEQISARRIQGMTFRGDYTRVIDSLRHTNGFEAYKHADLRFLLMHIGAKMDGDRPAWFDKNEDELYKLNDDLYHGFIAGHSHDPVCGVLNTSRKPVVQGWWHGMYVSTLLCRMDTTTMRVVSIEPRLVPVPMHSRAELTPRALRLQEQIDSLLRVTTTDGGTPIGTQLTVCTEDMPHDRTDKYRLSPVGTLVCEAYATAYREAAGATSDLPVIGVSHFGSIRGGFSKGPVSVLEVGEVLPFNNKLGAYKVDGKLFKQLVEFGFHNTRYGWLQASNLETKRDKDNHVLSLYYVAPSGRKTKITDNTSLIIIADEFVANGGDGYSTDFFPKSQRQDVAMPAATDAFINYLKGKKQIP